MQQRTRIEFKQNSKKLIREPKSKAYLISAVFVALSFIMNVLISNLSGMNQYMNNFVSEYSEAYVDAVELVEETQDYEAASDMLFEAMEEASVWPEVSTIAIILAVVIYVLMLIVSAGYDNYCLMVTRGETVGVKDLFDGFYYTGRLFLLIVIRSVLVAVGLMIFIVPGVMLLYSYRMAIYVAFDHPEWGAIACLKESRHMAKGRKSELFSLDVSFIGWYFASQAVASFTVPIVDMWVKPYMGFTVAQMYNRLSGYQPKAAEETVSGSAE